MTRVQAGWQQTRLAACVAAVLAVAACSSDEPSSAIHAEFVPDQAAPGAGTVALAAASSRGDLVTVRIRVTDVDGLYGASFYLLHDPELARMASWAPGDVLEQGQHTPFYEVQEVLPGTIIVGASRLGPVPPVSVVGGGTLLSITYQVQAVGDGAVDFQGAILFDGQLQPQPLPGIQWFGGRLIGS